MPPMKFDTSPNIKVDKEALRERLTPIEYQVTQEKMTERWETNFQFFKCLSHFEMILHMKKKMWKH